VGLVGLVGLVGPAQAFLAVISLAGALDEDSGPLCTSPCTQRSTVLPRLPWLVGYKRLGSERSARVLVDYRLLPDDERAEWVRVMRARARRDAEVLTPRPGQPIYGLAAPALTPAAVTRYQALVCRSGACGAPGCCPRTLRPIHLPTPSR
jgi:hypothetical protein